MTQNTKLLNDLVTWLKALYIIFNLCDPEHQMTKWPSDLLHNSGYYIQHLTSSDQKHQKTIKHPMTWPKNELVSVYIKPLLSESYKDLVNRALHFRILIKLDILTWNSCYTNTTITLFISTSQKSSKPYENLQDIAN